MPIAPVGALQLSMSSLPAATSASEQFAVQTAAQPAGIPTDAGREKKETDKMAPLQRPAEPARQAATAQQATAQELPGQTVRNLFDYVGEVEKTVGRSAYDPSALLASAMRSLESTMQGVEAALAGGATSAKRGMRPAGAGERDASGRPSGPQSGGNLDELLDRSISVMWAATNLQIVSSSVTALTSSTSTLIKQQ